MVYVAVIVVLGAALVWLRGHLMRNEVLLGEACRALGLTLRGAHGKGTVGGVAVTLSASSAGEVLIDVSLPGKISADGLAALDDAWRDADGSFTLTRRGRKRRTARMRSAPMGDASVLADDVREAVADRKRRWGTGEGSDALASIAMGTAPTGYRAAAARLLVETYRGTGPTNRVLSDLGADPDPHMRLAAARLHSGAKREQLLRELADWPETSADVLEACYREGDRPDLEEDVTAQLKRWGTGGRGARYEVEVWTAVRLGLYAPLPHLGNVLANAEREELSKLVDYLTGIGAGHPAALEHLKALFRHPRLGRGEWGTVYSAVRPHLSDEEHRVFLDTWSKKERPLFHRAVRSLLAEKSPLALDYLDPLLKWLDADELPRICAQLAHFEDEAAVRAVARMVDHWHEGARVSAKKALREFRCDVAVGATAEMLILLQENLAADSQPSQSLIDLLGRYGTIAAVEPLMVIRDGDSEEVTERAADAIEKIQARHASGAGAGGLTLSTVDVGAEGRLAVSDGGTGGLALAEEPEEPAEPADAEDQDFA